MGSSNDLAFVFDMFGTVGSTAHAGVGDSFDLAGAFGDQLHALATGAEFIFQILPFV